MATNKTVKKHRGTLALLLGVLAVAVVAVAAWLILKFRGNKGKKN